VYVIGRTEKRPSVSTGDCRCLNGDIQCSTNLRSLPLLETEEATVVFQSSGSGSYSRMKSPWEIADRNMIVGRNKIVEIASSGQR